MQFETRLNNDHSNKNLIFRIPENLIEKLVKRRMKLLPSLVGVALTYEQPKYDDFLRSLQQKKSGWGAPTGKIAALWSLCPALTTPTNGQVVCDQATCALVCNSGQF